MGIRQWMIVQAMLAVMITSGHGQSIPDVPTLSPSTVRAPSNTTASVSSIRSFEVETLLLPTISTPLVASSSPPAISFTIIISPSIATSVATSMATSVATSMATSMATSVATSMTTSMATSVATSVVLESSVVSTRTVSSIRTSPTPTLVTDQPAGVDLTVYRIKVAMVAICNGVLLLIFVGLIVTLIVIKVWQQTKRKRLRRHVEENRSSMIDNPTYGTGIRVASDRERGARSSQNGHTEDNHRTEGAAYRDHRYTESETERELINPLYGSAQECMETSALEDCHERDVVNPIYGDTLGLDCPTVPAVPSEKTKSDSRNKMIHQRSCPEERGMEVRPSRSRRHSCCYENQSLVIALQSSSSTPCTPVIKQTGRGHAGKAPVALPRKKVAGSAEMVARTK